MESVTPGLREDFEKVSSAEAAIEEIEARILDHSASRAEILQWYFAKDPLRQNYYEEMATLMKSYDIDTYKSHMLREGVTAEAMEKGATALAVSVFLPTAMQDAEIDWHSTVSKWYRDTYGLADADTEISTADMLIFCLEHNSNDAMDMEDFETLHIVTEMLIKSSSDHAFELAEILKNGGDWGDLKQEIVDWQYSPRQASNMLLAKHLSTLITEIIFDSVDDNPDARKFLLRTVPLYIATEINDICAPSEDIDNDVSGRQLRAEVIQKYIHILEGIATGDNRVQHEGKSIKGSLHEAIWLLDMLVLREIHESDFTIIPSSANEDMPEIGYPTFNRSFDFMIIGPSRGDWLIQLKSTPSNPKKQNQSNYHPEIDLKAEQNFRDFHYKTLRSKLNLYKSLIASNFTDPDLIARVEKMALETARVTFEEYTANDDSRYQHMLDRFDKFGIVFDTPPPNYDKRIMAIMSGVDDPGFNRAHKRALNKLNQKQARSKTTNIKPTRRTNGPNPSSRKK